MRGTTGKKCRWLLVEAMGERVSTEGRVAGLLAQHISLDFISTSTEQFLNVLALERYLDGALTASCATKFRIGHW